MNIRQKFIQRRQRGFNLLEVLVATAVGGIGVLAFAGLQLKSIEITREASQRTIAAHLANELVERMMSNGQDANAKAIYQDGTAPAWTDGVPDQTSYPSTWGTNCIGVTGCAPEVMATFDILSMRWLAQGHLINGKIGTMQCTAGSLEYECIQVAWEDTTLAECTGPDADKKCYILQIKIW